MINLITLRITDKETRERFSKERDRDINWIGLVILAARLFTLICGIASSLIYKTAGSP